MCFPIAGGLRSCRGKIKAAGRRREGRLGVLSLGAVNLHQRALPDFADPGFCWPSVVGNDLSFSRRSGTATSVNKVLNIPLSVSMNNVHAMPDS
jgi:hypothetical protein